MMGATTLGRLWAAVRLARRVNQRDLAAAVNVTPEQVSRWENGIHIPRSDKMRAVNRYLQIPAGVADDVAEYSELPQDVLDRLAHLLALGYDPDLPQVLADLGYQAE